MCVQCAALVKRIDAGQQVIGAGQLVQNKTEEPSQQGDVGGTTTLVQQVDDPDNGAHIVAAQPSSDSHRYNKTRNMLHDHNEHALCTWHSTLHQSLTNAVCDTKQLVFSHWTPSPHA
jgi:hypothetical protein